MMTKFADPCRDIPFKKLFADQKHKDVLISFLNAVLEREGERRIVDVVILDTNNTPEINSLKLTILDVRCTDQSGHQYIVEMQRKNQSDFGQRSLFYVSQVYTRQLKPREEYSELMPVIFVGVLNFSTFKGENPVSHHLILNTQTHEQELKHQEFHFVELPKFTKKENELETVVDKWLYLLKNAYKMEAVPEALNSPKAMHEALDILSTYRWTKSELEAYEKELDRVRVEKSILRTERDAGREEGEQVGEQKKTIAIAKQMLAKGLDAALVCEVTGLSEEEISRLK